MSVFAPFLALFLAGLIAAYHRVSLKSWAVLSVFALAIAALLGASLIATVIAGLLFPLSYMLFLVPFGDELIPALQTITARLTVALTHLSGIKADIDGVFINTPVGLFEVAEACSGVKFLIAMAALAVRVAMAVT